MKVGDRGSVRERWERDCPAEGYKGLDCWSWLGARSPFGHGKLFVNGKYEGAHRVAWTLYRGAIPEGLWVLHKCDEPWCVNPSHLFLGDHRANMQDCADKGRNGMARYPERSALRGKSVPRPKGSANGLSKLTEAQVAAIRDEWSRTRQRTALARRYNVTRATIDRIVEGRSWKHVTAFADADRRAKP